MKSKKEQTVENLEDYLDLIDASDSKVNEKKVSKRRKSDSKILGQQKKEDENKSKDSLAPNSIAALNKSANDVLNSYINRAPQYKTIKQQIEVLQQTAIEYKKAGQTEYYEECRVKIVELSGTKKKFESIVKSKTQADIDTQNEGIKNSEKLKELRNERKELETEYSALNPASLITRLSKIREKLAFKKDIIGIEEEEDEIIDLNDELDSELENIDDNLDKMSLRDEYNELCEFFSDKTSYSIDEIKEMNSNSIIRAYKESMTDEDKEYIADLKKRLDINKMEASSEMKRIKGYNDITDVMYDIFDFETEEEAPKEMLAASNVKYVEAIAYNTCSKINALHHFADCVGYGLVGLTVAINKWYNIQKVKDHALSFEGFAHLYVVNSIKRGLYELTSGGMYTGSAMATREHYRNKNYEYWLENNKELKDLPKELIEDLLDGAYGNDKPADIVTESQYKSIVGGEEDDNADIWANATKSVDNLAESKIEYENLVNSLKTLFSLFEKKEDKQTGISKVTNKKLFDKYDYRLFLMAFGLITKENAETDTKEQFTQAEMAKEMERYYAENGIKKTFSQPAINARLKSIMERIQKAFDYYPELRKGFEYLMYYFMSHSEDINLLSNSREELGYSFNIQNRSTTDDEKFNEAMLNSQKEYQELEDSMDDDIASVFNQYN